MDKFLFISGFVFMAFICAVLASLNPHMFGEWVTQLRFPAGVLYGAFSVLWIHYYFRKRNGKVKCPKCGHEFEIEAIPVLYPKIKPDTSGSSLVYRNLEIDPKTLLYCGPYKEIHLSCGHSFRCEFSQYYKGQKVWCPECGKHSKVVKLIDTVTGKEHDRL